VLTRSMLAEEAGPHLLGVFPSTRLCGGFQAGKISSWAVAFLIANLVDLNEVLHGHVRLGIDCANAVPSTPGSRIARWPARSSTPVIDKRSGRRAVVGNVARITGADMLTAEAKAALTWWMCGAATTAGGDRARHLGRARSA
jgi:hypothetical protein